MVTQIKIVQTIISSLLIRMKYVYYDPATMQIMAEFNTPNLSDQANWVAKGYMRALIGDVPAGRDHRILTIVDDVIMDVFPSINPIQPEPAPRTRLDDLRDKLAGDTINLTEIREMLRLERRL